MNSVWNWFIQLFTSGAFLIVVLYALAPLLHLIQSARNRRRLHRRILAGKLNPKGFQVRLELGEIYCRSRRWKSAIPELEQAVRIDPDHAHCRSLLGRAYFKTGNFGKAVEHLKAALKIRPEEGYGETHLLIGRSCEALGDLDSAADWYSRSLQRNRSFCEPAYRLSLVQKKRNQPEEYAKYLKETLHRFSSYDRRNFWKNLPFAVLAKVRFRTGI